MITTNVLTETEAIHKAHLGQNAKRKGSFQETVYTLMILENIIKTDGLSLSSAIGKLAEDERMTDTFHGKREQVRDRANEWIYGTKAPRNHDAVALRNLPSLDNESDALAFETEWLDIQKNTRDYNKKTTEATAQNSLLKKASSDPELRERFVTDLAAVTYGDSETVDKVLQSRRDEATGKKNPTILETKDKAAFLIYANEEHASALRKAWRTDNLKGEDFIHCVNLAIAHWQELADEYHQSQVSDDQFDAIESYANNQSN